MAPAFRSVRRTGFGFSVRTFPRFARALRVGAFVVAAILPRGGANASDSPTWNIDGTVKCVAQVGHSLYFGGDFQIVDSHPGSGVPVEASGGSLVMRSPVVQEGSVDASVADGAGGWYIGGSLTQVGGLPRAGLAHILADGTLAPWAPSAFGRVRALGFIGNVVYVGGEQGLFAVDAVTGERLPWDPQLYGPVGALATSGDTLYIGGAFSSLLGLPRLSLAAYDPRTGEATDWDPQVGGESYVTCLAIHGGTVYFGGDFTSVAGSPRFCAAAVDARTGELRGWDAKVIRPPYQQFFGSDIVSTISATDEAVYLGGWFAGVGTRLTSSVAAVDPQTGAPLPWSLALNGGYGFTDFPVVLAIQAVGSNVFVGGMFWTGNYRFNFVVADAATGNVRHWDIDTDLAVTSIAPSGGRVYVGGVFGTFVERRHCLALIDLDTGDLTSWNSGIEGTRVNALAVRDSLLFVGGSFSSVSSRTLENLAVINARTGSPTAFGCGSNGEVKALLQQGSTLFVGGTFTELYGPPLSILSRNGVGAFDLTGNGGKGAILPWNPESDGEVDALASDGARLYVGGRFSSIGGEARQDLAALDLSLGGATSWDPGADGPVTALATSGETIFAGGPFHSAGGQPRSGIAQVSTITGLVTPFDLPVIGGVNTFALGDGNLYFGGSFDQVGGATRHHLAAVRLDSDALVPWAPAADGEVNTLLLNGTTILAGGAFASVDGQSSGALAAIKSAGAPDGNTAVARGAGPGLELLCSPSPAVSSVSIAFSLPSAARVSLAIYDLSGRRMASLIEDQRVDAGAREFRITTDSWRAGCYFCRLSTGLASVTRKILIVR